MPEENISIFRQELERVKAQFEDQFQDIMASVRADRENDKRTLQMVNENLNNDRKAIDQNRALNDKLETLLNVQNTMLSELRSMNNSMKDLSGGGGGMGLGGLLAGAAAGGLAGLFLNGDGDNNVDGGGGNDLLRTTRGGGTRDTGGGGRQRQPASGDVAERIRTTLMEKFTSEEMRDMGIDEEKAAMLTEAFIMNFQDESGLDPDIVEGAANAHGTFGKGLYQLTGPRRNEYESIYGEDYSVENQMDFLIRELMTSESSAFRKILEGETVGETAGAIVRDFLRPAAQYRNTRMAEYSQDTRGGSAVLEEYQRMEEERQRREEEADAERVEGDAATQALRIDLMKTMVRQQTGDTSLRQFGGTKVSGEGALWQQGGQGPHDFINYKSDYSLGTSFEWEELPSNITEGENTITLSDGRVAKFVVSQVGNSFVSSHLVYAEDYTNEFGNAFKAGDPITGLSYNKAENEARALGGDITSLDTLKYIAQNFPIEKREAMGVVGGDSTGTQAEAEEMARRNREANQSSLLPVTEERPDIFGGDDVDDLSGGIGNDTLEPQSPVGPRIPETSPEQDPFDPFSLVSPMRLSGDLTTIGLNENPELRAALEEQAAAETEETPRETTSGGYTGGGGGSSEQEQPQIEANAIGRFPWAEKLIKYYNLSNMIKTNMLS